jgi:hypothetical protein
MTPDRVIVHVGAPHLACRIGLVLVAGPGLSRVRVLTPAAVGVVGLLDEEGDMPHHSDARQVPNPDGTYRWLVSWHTIDECEKVTP